MAKDASTKDSMVSNNWLENLKPGDRVIVKQRDRYYQENRIEVIKSIGKKFISLQDFSNRFLVENGSSVASRDLPHRYQLLEATEDAIAEIDQQKQKQELVEKLKKVNFEKMPLQALQQINQIIEKSRE